MIKRPLGKEVLVRTFWDTYDFLGRLIFINLIALFAVYLTQLIALFVFPKVAQSEQEAQNYAIYFPLYSALTICFVLCFWSSGLIRFLREVSKGTEPGSKLFGKYILKPTPAMIAFWIIAPLLIIYIFLAHFAFSSIFRQFPWGDFAYAFALGLSFWFTVLIFFKFLSGMWFREMGIQLSLKDSFLIILKYGRLHLGFVFFLILLGFLIYVSRMAVFVLFGFFLPFVYYNALMQVIMENEIAADLEKELDEEKATTWEERKALEEKQEAIHARNERYNRSFRDILKPWGDNYDN